MKKLLRILFLCISIMLSGLFLMAQGIQFKTNVKQPKPSGFTLPQPVLTGHPSAFSKNPAGRSMVSFQPRQVNLNDRKLHKEMFADITYDYNGRLLFAKGRLPDAVSFSLKASNDILEACFQYLNALKPALHIETPSEEFVLIKHETDDLNMDHIRLQQVFYDIPVYGGEAYLHGKDGFIEMFNGFTYPTPRIDNLNPSISANQAITLTTDHVSGKTAFRQLSDAEKSLLHYKSAISELVIYHPFHDTNREVLVWHITIRPNLIERWEYFVDAHSGSIIYWYNNTQSDGDVIANGTDLNGVNQTFHVYLEAGTYYMVDVSRPMFNPQSFEGVIQTYTAYNAPYNQITNAALVSSSSNTWAPNAISAHYHASLAYEYWRTVHNRNSYNNQGGSIINVINITDENGQGFDNAFWSGQAMFYGNGGTLFKPLAGALDVCAHELGHAVDETSANLEYQYQSGAINESYSDIIGAMVERQNWQLGEGIILPGNPYFPTGAMRDMSNPHNGGSSFSDPCYQPAHVNEMYTGTDDNGGVHINSGIGNYAYYLFATAVGLEKAEKVFMRALFNYLTRTSQFSDLRIAVVQAATDLYGGGSAEVTAAGNAFTQVGITTSGGGGGGITEPGTLQTNPGQDYILAFDQYPGDPSSLLVLNTTGTSYTPISQTDVKNKPSILDDGSAAVFISGDSKMRIISLNGPPDETIIQDETIWDGVAITKDGSRISAVTIYQDSSIYVYSYEKGQWVKFDLYNPGTQSGIATYNVLYADAMEWMYDGQYIMYDAYTRFNGPQGQTIDFWDINFIRVWDNNTHDWGDGQIFKMLSGLEEGISVGNPSLSKNSTHIASFDMYDSNEDHDYILAVNLDNGDVGEVFDNGTTMGTPNYSKHDDKLIFTTWNVTSEDIAFIGMQPDKIHPSGNPTVFFQYAKWGIWYAQGIRDIGINELTDNGMIKIYPNPSQGRPTIWIEKVNNKPVQVSLVDIHGSSVFFKEVVSQGSFITPDLSTLPSGLYMIRLIGQDFTYNTKILIQK
jgi:Zn-dependent metalloprotease